MMNCPRIDHFVRLNKDGKIGKCGHMNNHVGFDSFEELQNSDWLARVRKDFEEGNWPKECVRCQQTEKSHGDSVRIKSVKRHQSLVRFKKDYLVVGGVLDNVCNSACQTCNAGLSTKIGSLESKNYPRVDNYTRFWEIPQDRIVELDVNGGEPTASRNYKKLLSNLPKNVRVVRINTNGSKIIPEVESLLEKKIIVIITLSLDGTDRVHDYVRWPIKWDKYKQIVDCYIELKKKHSLLKLDFWTTVSCFNVADLANIQKYASEKGIPHTWAYLTDPKVLDVKHQNSLTKNAQQYTNNKELLSTLYSGEKNEGELFKFIKYQDLLRGIDIKNYLNF